MTQMNRLRQRPWWLAVALALTLSTLSGCQTYFWETGQTLPTGWYLRHPPQFIPPTPQFPLPNEEADLTRAALRPGLVQPLPPPGPALGPAPAPPPP
jgi:hypothetical protein